MNEEESTPPAPYEESPRPPHSALGCSRPVVLPSNSPRYLPPLLSLPEPLSSSLYGVNVAHLSSSLHPASEIVEIGKSGFDTRQSAAAVELTPECGVVESAEDVMPNRLFGVPKASADIPSTMPVSLSTSAESTLFMPERISFVSANGGGTVGCPLSFCSSFGA